MERHVDNGDSQGLALNNGRTSPSIRLLRNLPRDTREIRICICQERACLALNMEDRGAYEYDKITR